MHYRTDALNFLDPPDGFLEALGPRVGRLDASDFVVEGFLGTARHPTVVLPAPRSSLGPRSVSPPASLRIPRVSSVVRAPGRAGARAAVRRPPQSAGARRRLVPGPTGCVALRARPPLRRARSALRGTGRAGRGGG